MTVLDLEPYLRARLDLTSLQLERMAEDSWLVSVLCEHGVAHPFCYLEWVASPEPAHHVLDFWIVVEDEETETALNGHDGGRLRLLIRPEEEFLLFGPTAQVMRMEMALELVRAGNAYADEHFLSDFETAFRHTCLFLGTLSEGAQPRTRH